MKINDAVWGAVLLLLAAAILVHVQSFPKIPGQNVGPALFPGLIAAGLAVCAVLLVIKGLAARRRPGHANRGLRLKPGCVRTVTCSRSRWSSGSMSSTSWSWTGLASFPPAVIYLAVLFLVFRVPRTWIVPLAIVITLGIHYAFYKLLKVPLPWGFLQGIAW